MRKIIALIIILSGIIVISIPYIQKQYYMAEEQKLINEFLELNQIFLQQQESNDYDYMQDEIILQQDKNFQTSVIGLLQIEKINLTIPILKGATEENLKIGAGMMANTSPLGSIGNTGIAAHRSFTYGRMFNRLDEITVGDIVEVETFEGVLKYEVFDKMLVLPDDTSVLNPVENESIITLITCEPMYNPTHRLIIQAKKVS